MRISTRVGLICLFLNKGGGAKVGVNGYASQYQRYNPRSLQSLELSQLQTALPNYSGPDITETPSEHSIPSRVTRNHSQLLAPTLTLSRVNPQRHSLPRIHKTILPHHIHNSISPSSPQWRPRCLPKTM